MKLRYGQRMGCGGRLALNASLRRYARVPRLHYGRAAAMMRAPPHPSRLAPCHLPLEGKAFLAAVVLSAAPLASPRGEAVAQATDEVASCRCGSAAAVQLSAAPLAFLGGEGFLHGGSVPALRPGCSGDVRPTSSVTARAVPPSPRGEGFFRSGGVGFPPRHWLPLEGKLSRQRLMRWHLAAAGRPRQCSFLPHHWLFLEGKAFFAAVVCLLCGRAAAMMRAPPHPSRLAPCHLPLEGKAFFRSGGAFCRAIGFPLRGSCQRS